MNAFYTAPENVLFAGAFALLLLLALLQFAGMAFGFGLGSALDNLIPDFDADLDLDLDTAADVDALDAMDAAPGFFAGMLSWLNLGKVPFLISLSVLLLLFSMLGYLLQALFLRIGIGLLPVWLVGPPVFLVSMIPWRESNRLLGRIVPRDESAAVSADTFIGRIATITIGTATSERAAEARLQGPLGRTHYVMVRADSAGDSFAQGSHVLLVNREGPHFLAIATPDPELADLPD